MVERSVLTEPRTSGGERRLESDEQGGSRATIEGSPGRTRPTSNLDVLFGPIILRVENGFLLEPTDADTLPT
jgi:hypothetical protein